ncbi:VTT domain-containing protein [Candidatus Pelagibacter sp.]|nr:VTT domain-containing protein [Candidatus Pelagibacter sp.]|tara:strand:+ start:161 stop:880 length:720 start_codon:yes stop_codon:yes gene_type:complete
MEKAKKIKIFVGLFYLLVVCLFLYFFFSKFSLEEITSYDFIKNNRDYFFELKRSSPVLLSGLFFLFCIIWTLVGGFGSPIVLFAGFVFGNWLGTLLLIFGMTIGATILYILANYFFKELIKEKFLTRFQNLESKFKKSEFLYLLIYRVIGGIPFVISNILPCMFNVKILNFFGATFIGMLPQIFIFTSIASGLEKIIDQNLEAPGVLDIITSSTIYIPLIAFLVLVMVTIFVRKLLYNK